MSTLTNIATQIVYSRLITEATLSFKDVQTNVIELGKDLKSSGKNVTDDDVQAALLASAITANGNLDAIAADSIDSVKTESTDYVITESGVIHTIEVIGSILGNVALMNVICKSLEKYTGKQIDANKIIPKLQKFIKALKSVTGYPAKVIEEFFMFVAKKAGVSLAGQKVSGISGAILTIMSLFILGLAFFPVLGASPLMVLLSITGLIGKGFELKSLYSHLKKAVDEYMKEAGSIDNTAPDAALA